MRLNAFIAQQTGLSRRASDVLIKDEKVLVNNQVATPGMRLNPRDTVIISGHKGCYTYTDVPPKHTTIILNKPVGYVCSRNGQGSKTIYELLPKDYHKLKPVGRLDKNSSGLLLLTDDGQLANQLTHPRYEKQKVYEIGLDKPLAPLHWQMISDHGIQLDDGPSQFHIDKLDSEGLRLKVTMKEGRNRQIRRTFAALGYQVITLHRTKFGEYTLINLERGNYLEREPI